jgi:hypothetical protein
MLLKSKYLAIIGTDSFKYPVTIKISMIKYGNLGLLFRYELSIKINQKPHS